MQQNYQLGKLVGKLMFRLEESVETYKTTTIEAYKTRFQFAVETLAEILLFLEESHISDPSIPDITQEIERLIEKYGELKFDKDDANSSRIIGGFKRRVSDYFQNRQSKKKLKNEDAEILYGKIRIWDDRINIALGMVD